VDLILVFIALATIASSVDSAFRSGKDGPSWELRWRSLDAADRERIEAAVRSNSELADPEDAELAAGLRRHQFRRHAYLELVAAPFVLVAAALALTGTLSFGTFGFVAFLSLGFAAYVVPRLVKRREPLAQ
jgi:hypothetical protein